MAKITGIIRHLSGDNMFAYCKNQPIGRCDYNRYWSCVAGMFYIQLAFNNWETNTILSAITYGTIAIEFIIAMAAYITGGTAVPVMGVVLAGAALVIGKLQLLNHLGGNKGIYFRISYSVFRGIDVITGINKKEPKGYEDIWDIYKGSEKYVKKIVKAVGKNKIKKLASKSNRNQICVLAQIMYDKYTGKKIKKVNYYIR